MSQFLSGHGDFNNKLKSFNLSEMETCDCGEEEILQHVSHDCPIYNEDRQKLRDAIKDLALT
jgi:hypothetical protein